MPSAEIAVQVNDLELGSFLERIESSNFSDPEEAQTSSTSDEITFTESPGQIHQNTITNEHSRLPPDLVFHLAALLAKLHVMSLETKLIK